MAVVNLVGCCILFAGFAAGAPVGGLAWMFVASSALVLLSLAVGAVFAVGGFVLGGFSKTRWMGRGAIAGAKVTPVGVFVVAFTRWGGELRLSEAVSEVAPGEETVWVPQYVVGPLEAGTLLTFLIGLMMFGCLIASVLYMIRFFTRIPSWDRYEHGYGVRPGIWNLLVTGPLALVGWFVISDVSVVRVPVAGGHIPLSAWVILTGLLFVPIPLATVYSLRRRVEPWITS